VSSQSSVCSMSPSVASSCPHSAARPDTKESTAGCTVTQPQMPGSHSTATSEEQTTTSIIPQTNRQYLFQTIPTQQHTTMAVREAPKPLRRRVPIFTFTPPHSSFGIGPRNQLENGVSATSTLAEREVPHLRRQYDSRRENQPWHWVLLKRLRSSVSICLRETLTIAHGSATNHSPWRASLSTTIAATGSRRL
jgi:hypothetical protein